MMTFNKIKQLLYFSICLLSNFFVNYLPDVYLNTSKLVKITGQRLILVLKILDVSMFTWLNEITNVREFHGSERIIAFRREMSRRTRGEMSRHARGEMSSFDRLH